MQERLLPARGIRESYWEDIAQEINYTVFAGFALACTRRALPREYNREKGHAKV